MLVPLHLWRPIIPWLRVETTFVRTCLRGLRFPRTGLGLWWPVIPVRRRLIPWLLWSGALHPRICRRGVRSISSRSPLDGSRLGPPGRLGLVRVARGFLVWSSRSGRPYRAVATELARHRRCGDFRFSVILARPLRRFVPGNLLLLQLLAHGPGAPGTGRRHFRAGGTGIDSSAAAVVADARAVVVHNHPLVVHVYDVDIGDVSDFAVVVKAIAAPLSAVVALARVAVAVVDSSVETDFCSPVTRIIDVSVSVLIPTPVVRGPNRAYKRRWHPGTRHPEVTKIWIPIPISRRPDVTGTRNRRLLIIWERRRAETDKNAHRSGRFCRCRQHGQHQKQRANQA